MSAPEMPERIWLIPDIGWDGETAWSNDPAPEPGMDPDNATEYLRKDLCASGQQVRVKSLEWESSETSYTQANCVLGQYQITFLGEFECWQLSAPPKRGTYWKDGFSRHASKSAAKAAAQADYERRILAALTPAPQPAGEAVAEPRVICLPYPMHGYGVCVGGRYDGWLMWQHPDGQWLSKTKLAADDPAKRLSAALRALKEVEANG